MAKTLIIKLDDQSIASSYEGSPSQSSYGGPWGDSSAYAHVALPDGMDAQYVTVDENLVVTEEAGDTAARDAAALEALRNTRCVKLEACDWTQLPDVALGAGQVTLWATYRQELRDITNTYQSLDTVVWPTEPPPEV